MTPTDILFEALVEGNFSPDSSNQSLTELRKQLGLSENEHFSILLIIGSEKPELLYKITNDFHQEQLSN